MNKLIFLLVLSLLCINGVLFWRNAKAETAETGWRSTCRLTKKPATLSNAVVLPGGILTIN